MRKFSAASEEFNMYDEDTLEELVTQSEIVRYRLQTIPFPLEKNEYYRIYRKYLYPYQGPGNNGKVCEDAGKIWRVFWCWNKDRNGNGCNEIYQEE